MLKDDKDGFFIGLKNELPKDKANVAELVRNIYKVPAVFLVMLDEPESIIQMSCPAELVDDMIEVMEHSLAKLKAKRAKYPGPLGQETQ